MAGRSFLDGVVARLIACAIFVACGAALAWLHRDDLFQPGEEGVPADDPLAHCLAERREEIAQMADEGLISGEQIGLFRARAEAMCRAGARASGGPPVLPAE